MTNVYTKTRIRRIARRFGLTARKSKPIASMYRKNAIIRVHTDTDTYALKPYCRNVLLRTSAVQQMRSVANCIRLLMAGGYRYMPEWVPTRGGALWTVKHGRPFYVTKWIFGRGLQTEEDFAELGRALAALHTSGGLLPATESPTREQMRLWKAQDRHFQCWVARPQAYHPHATIRAWIKKYGIACAHLASQAWHALQSPEATALFEEEKLRPALVHSDVTTPNVKISGDGRLFIIDWDRVKIGSAYVDTANALMNTTQFDPAFIHSLLRGYEECRPLTPPERRIIAALYGLPREAWYAARFPKLRRSGDMLDIVDRTWPHRLNAMNIMADWANQ